ncbi:MAG: regulatory signaling modulator protein AmpE [Kangiellaceae bacterium]|nr:regulatory signaling modulator protein AmpE [Kangiellaceae bacterium]
MILICLLVATALEFHFKIGSEYRKFAWFIKLRDLYTGLFADQGFFDSQWGIAILLLTPIVILWGASSLFDGVVFWLIWLVISALILFYSLGPIPLEKSFRGYFDSMERADFEAAYLHLQDDSSDDTAQIPESDELVRAATRKILIESQKRYFGVIGWFILLGPLAALLYRLAHIYQEHCVAEGFNEHAPLMQQFIHWIDWIPARMTTLMFLLTGDFVNGFYRIQDYLLDADADNNQLISETGIAALGLEISGSDSTLEENHQTISMIRRAVIFYLVIGAIVTLIV